MSRISFNPSISLGNLLTIVGLLMAIIGVYVSIETANAKRDEKLVYFDQRITKNEGIQKDVQDIKVQMGKLQEGQKNQGNTLDRILNHLERK